MERKNKFAATLMLAFMPVFIIVCSPTPGWAAGAEPWPLVLRSQIEQLTRVGYRLGIEAAPLCPSTAAGTGLSLDYIKAYDSKDRNAIAALLGMSDAPQVVSIAPGSPADIAGIKPGDDLVLINKAPVLSLQRADADVSLLADDLEQYLAAMPLTNVITLGLRRNGQFREAQLMPQPVCATRFILKTGLGISAFSDGANVAISSKLIAFTKNDDELALVAAHEVGHIINGDGEASSLRERRKMEDRADVLGAQLAHCAGYNAETGLQFWLRRDAEDWLRLLRDPSHRSRSSRVKLMRQRGVTSTCPPAVGAEAETD